MLLDTPGSQDAHLSAMVTRLMDDQAARRRNPNGGFIEGLVDHEPLSIIGESVEGVASSVGAEIEGLIDPLSLL